MCDFPSWIEKDGNIFFLTDKDCREHSILLEDGVGHHGIRKIFPNLGGSEHEGFPCPTEIITAINRKQMQMMMRAAGYKKLAVRADGHLHREDGPAVEYADGTKAWAVGAKPK